jgi:hypothetical protein
MNKLFDSRKLQLKFFKYFVTSRTIFNNNNYKKLIIIPSFNRIKSFSIPALAIIGFGYYFASDRDKLIANCQSNRNEIDKCNL